MSDIAKKTGLGRDNLYKAVSGNIKPKLGTVNKILTAVDLSPSVEKIAATE